MSKVNFLYEFSLVFFFLKTSQKPARGNELFQLELKERIDTAQQMVFES